ncbi:hypothetical protein Cagg_3273 [Chloroflexus aggregans DSM 9485]|uniref:Uncharacterized protein n=1 Tax=Chloroflexus aggregans (strain MD-66 / DSM 9485) TaxID=326427 RepID=B8G874_CHLAD|nr:hypothetical protein Cagg_3273 [Chloroflexus aggregans DSM 9485]
MVSKVISRLTSASSRHAPLASLAPRAADARAVSRGRGVAGCIKGISIQGLVGRCNNVGVEPRAGIRPCPRRQDGEAANPPLQPTRSAVLRVRLSGRPLGGGSYRIQSKPVESHVRHHTCPDAKYLLLPVTVTGGGSFWVSGWDGTIVVGDYYIRPESEDQKRGWKSVIDFLSQEQCVKAFAGKGGDVFYQITSDGRYRAERPLELWAQHRHVKNRYDCDENIAIIRRACICHRIGYGHE